MTGHAYATSARTAGRMGPFAGYADNAEPMLNVLRMHRAEAAKIDEELVPPELLSRRPAVRGTRRSSSASGTACATRRPRVLAPTGTIGLMMDCDTTGIEPDLALTKAKKLVGGGTMFIVNQTIPRALRKARLPDEPGRRDHRLHRRAQDDHRRAGLQRRAPAGVRVLDGRQHDPLHGPRHDDGRGAAVHLAARSRKTVNMPEEATVEDIEQLHIEAWQLGLKAVAHLPRQLQGRPAAVDAEEGGRGRRARAARSSSRRPIGSSSGSSST